MTDKVMLDSPPASISITCSAASASAAVPAGTEILGIVATSPVHYRIGVGAQTAVQSDPMASPGFQPLFIKLDADQSYTIAAILDTNQGPVSPATAATLNAFKCYEA